MTRIRVVIADPHPVVVAGLVCELGKRRSLEVLGTARDAQGIIDLLSRLTCDVLVTDHTTLNGKHSGGVSLLSSLRRRLLSVRILVLTATENPEIARQVVEQGLVSTLCKSSGIEEVISAIHATHRGLRPMSDVFPATTASTPPAPSTTSLSQREMRVLRLYVSGMSITAISAKLHRTKQTISAQKRSAMRKLGFECNAQLYLFALQTGLSDEAPASPMTCDLDDADQAAQVTGEHLRDRGNLGAPGT